MTCPIRSGPPLDAAAFAGVRREMVLRGGKWDLQVGDVSTLAPFPLLISQHTWRTLADAAERLTAELLSAEAELMSRPALHRRLGLPRELRKLLTTGDLAPTPAGVRTMRFDFHWTSDGWRISELNSDVPGGYAEASAFPVLMAHHFAGTRPAGDPGAVWADAVAQTATGPHVALLAAPAYMEDQQIVARLGRLLADRGCVPHLAGPRQVHWEGPQAVLRTDAYRGPLGMIVRFYQAEWLAALGGLAQACRFVAGSVTPVTNPMEAALGESKRFPLVWDKLVTPLPTWRALLMETRDPRRADWRDGDWVLKPAFGNNGDDVVWRSLAPGRPWRRTVLSVMLRPRGWAAQRRFVAEPVASPVGPVYPCLGVYTIDGRAVGIYGRVATKPLIDFEAIDAAVLIED